MHYYCAVCIRFEFLNDVINYNDNQGHIESTLKKNTYFGNQLLVISCLLISTTVQTEIRSIISVQTEIRSIISVQTEIRSIISVQTEIRSIILNHSFFSYFLIIVKL